MIRKILKYLNDENYRFLVNNAHGFYRNMPDDEFLKRLFRIKLGYELNLDDPKTFNEKLQWLKLYDRKQIYTTMVDKYAVKEYVAGIIGEQYIIPTLCVCDSFDEINFASLPNQFVLKCTHDSGGLVICRDKAKLDMKAARKKISSCLKKNYYYKFREWPYKGVKPRVIVEKYMEDESRELRDYKVLCFNGIPKLIEVHQGRYTDHQTQDFYDTGWHKTTISQANLQRYQATCDVAEKPEKLDEMLALSSSLAKGIPQLRVDWYQVMGKLYFGEMTFFDGAGLDPFDNYEDDLLLGNWIMLPMKESK